METKYPVLFRILAVLNLIGGLILGFVAVIILISNDTFLYFHAPFLLFTSFWYITASFCWFLSGKRSATYLITTAISSILLATGLILFYFVMHESSSEKQIVFSSGSAFLTLYALFNILAYFHQSVKNWKLSIKPNEQPKKGVVSAVYVMVMIAMVSFHFGIKPTHTTADESSAEEEIYSEDEYYEPDYSASENEIEIYERSFSHKMLTTLYGDIPARGDERYLYDCPYMKSGELITLNGIQYGQFIGGPNSLRHELFPVICAKNKLDFEDVWYMFSQRAEITIFKSLESPEVFNGEDEILRSEDQWLSGYSYKENFIRWAYSNFIPEPDAVIAGKKASEIYDVVFKRFFRLMVESYFLLRNNYVMSQEATWYNKVVHSDDYLLQALRDRYGDQLKSYIASEEIMMSPFQPYMAIGFWIRRHLDNTMNVSFDGLRVLMEKFDKAWFENQTNA